MLGIGGALHQNSFLHPPPAEKHMENVRRLSSLGGEKRVKVDDENLSSSRKRKRQQQQQQPTKESIDKKPRFSSEWIPMADLINEGKKKLQSGEKLNGVTFAFIGSSGCGKSSLIRKVFIDDLFTKKAAESTDGKKEFIIQVFTESSKSDAFKDLDKSILVDSKGLDEDNINWCYHMNEKYDKKYNFMIILDDVLDIQYKKLVKRMFLIMRNTNVSSLVSLQYPNLIPKSVRTSVYFTVLFYFNTDEGVELVVRGWLSSYLPGKSVRDKMTYYRKWTKIDDGHQMFLVDNLNHKCYLVKSNYYCKELPMLKSILESDDDEPESTSKHILEKEKSESSSDNE